MEKPHTSDNNGITKKNLTPPSQSTKTVTTGKNKSDKSDFTSKGQNKLEDLFEENLKDIYSAEKQLVEALPKVAQAAYSEDLKDAIENHLNETKRHVERLEKIFSRLNIDKSDEEECMAMKGLIEECNRTLEDFEESPVRDSALIINAQKIEHYEIAAYGSLVELADVLGLSGPMSLLERTLEEEGNADKDLTEISKDVNDEAYELGRKQQKENKSSVSQSNY